MEDHGIFKSAARYLVYGVLGTWLAASVLSQDPRRKFDKVRKWDPTGALIPDWRFFAPRPGMHDHHLLVRNELPDGSYTPWQEYVQVEPRKWQHSFWYPGRRAEKVVIDSVGALTRLQPDLKEGGKENVQVSVPYLTLLNYVTRQVPHHADGKRVQFMIATSAGYDDSEEPTALFLSNTHPLT